VARPEPQNQWMYLSAGIAALPVSAIVNSSMRANG